MHLNENVVFDGGNEISIFFVKKYVLEGGGQIGVES